MDQEWPCEVCGELPDTCICPPCPVCGEQGRAECYKEVPGFEVGLAQRMRRAYNEWKWAEANRQDYLAELAMSLEDDPYEEYIPPVKVYCKPCQGWINEDTTEFLDISEGPMGEDKMTFRCPTCQQVSTSSRVA